MAISRALQSRIKADADSPAFLYVPKGKSVSEQNWPLIASLLEALDKFRAVPWATAQARFVKEIRKKKLIDPYRSEKEEFSAVGRMQLPVWGLLGLAWVNEAGVPEVTDIGRRFIRGNTADRRKLLSMQVHRYQFYNPSHSRHFQEFKTFPVLSLYKVLQNVQWYLDREEFILFGSRIRDMVDATEIANLVEEWRACASSEQNDLLVVARTLPATSHTKNLRGTTYTKVWNNFGYIRNFLNLSNKLEVTGNRLIVPSKHRRRVRELVDAAQDAEFIEYQSKQDWLASYGTVPPRSAWSMSWPTAGDAKEYYERIGRIDAAVEAFERQESKLSKKHIDEYRKVQIVERVLEDILEQNLEQLEPGLDLVGRQYSTAVGPIDLLAQDKDGLYVVIELKRGRTSDQVVGQVLRYLGWVIDRLAEGDEHMARAIIVGREYDRKFAAAITQIRQVKPYTYDIRLRFDEWQK